MTIAKSFLNMNNMELTFNQRLMMWRRLPQNLLFFMRARIGMNQTLSSLFSLVASIWGKVTTGSIGRRGERMKKVALVAVALALMLLCAGIVIGYFVVPYLMPKENIQEKLHKENIPFNESDWHQGILVEAESVQQFSDFQQFVYAYEEKCDPLYNPYGNPKVYVDTHWKVVWIEVKNTEEMLVYVGFYFY